jgi:integrase
MRLLLTDRFCTSAKSDRAPQTDYFDEQVTGLALRVGESGKKSWTLHYTAPSDGKRVRLTLGSFPSTGLGAARARALEARTLIEAGLDPRAHHASAMTVADLVTSYLAKHRTKRDGSPIRSAAELQRRFKRDVVPVIGNVRLADLHKRDVNKVCDRILERGSPVTAARVFEDVRAAVRWAVRRGDLDRNPLEGMQKPGGSKPRERVLSDDEIRHLWHVLPEALEPQYQNILRLCLITGQRVGEVCGMRRSELDIAAREWRLPGSRTKNGHPHTCALTDLALSIIEAAAGNAEQVFPGKTVKRVAKAVNSANAHGRFGRLEQFTPHDLRRSALTGMARLGVAPIVLGHIANHRTTTKAGMTLARYVYHPYQAEARQALDRWSVHLQAIIAGKPATVVPMRRGA